jgi:hypothetical protein
MQLGIQQSLDLLKIFGDKAAAAGLFKTVQDAVIFKDAIETILVGINERDQLNRQLEKALSPVPKHLDKGE